MLFSEVKGIAIGDTGVGKTAFLFALHWGESFVELLTKFLS